MTALRRKAAGRRGLPDRLGRKSVQIGFLLLFLYPFVPPIYRQLTSGPAVVLTSWLLPWDPLLWLGHVAHRDWASDWTSLIIGAPLLVIAVTLLAGRLFCGWVCPVGTCLDLIRPLARWRPRSLAAGRPSSARRADKAPAGLRALFPHFSNSPARYLALVAVLAGSLLSLQALGAIDPLVVFSRASTVIATDLLALNRPILRVYVTLSLIGLAILALELWQPRFWCRHLCPLGALLSLPARFSKLQRQVDGSCTDCGQCRRGCPMRAIPLDGSKTRYGDCHLCLECEAICPSGAISFGWGALRSRTSEEAGTLGQPHRSVTRRLFVAGLAAGAAGLSVQPILQTTAQPSVVRPPGALPEADFLRTCVLCQECIRTCPAGALRPTTWLAGAAGMGTPQLTPRQGGCLFWTSCPQVCSQVCPTGAIRPMVKEAMKIGRAKVDRAACLAWDQGVKCLVCVEACPTGAAQPFAGRITVDPQKCSGCGLCEHACPVADGAIHVGYLAEADRAANTYLR